MSKLVCLLTVGLLQLTLSASLHALTSSAVTANELCKAIRANNLLTLHQLVTSSAIANLETPLHMRPLHYAAIYGSPEAVRLLLEAGGNSNARNQADATPLILAAWSYEKTRLFVEHGALVNVHARNGVTPLMVAASAHGNVAGVRYLLSHGADVGAVDAFSGDALLRAAGASDPEVLQLLLAHGADAHHANKAKMTALQLAPSFSDCKRVRLLLQKGADPNTSNSFAGRVKNGPIQLTHLTPLMLAAPHGDGREVDALLKAGARINDVDIRKMNPLMLSIATDHANPETVSKLIAAHADVNAKDKYGDSVLDWARKFNNPEIVSQLIEAGAQGKAAPPAPVDPAGSQAASAREAIRRSMPLLVSTGPQFFREGGGCAGCHHQPIYAQAYGVLTTANAQPDARLRRSFIDAMQASRPRLTPTLPFLEGPGGDYDTLLAQLMGYADLHEPANSDTDLMVHYVAVRQHPSGAWVLLGIARPPIEDSTIARTALAIRALSLYGWPARQSEFDERIRRARHWLQHAKPATTYEYAACLTGLHAAQAPNSDLRKFAAGLLKLQHADGGWSQTRFLTSDAYATGMVLHALYTTGFLNPHDPAYAKGTAFLLRTQFPDGSWYVRSRAPKFQPYFQSGFPFDHDQWISSSATAWALMALAPASTIEPNQSIATLSRLRHKYQLATVQ